MSKIGIISVATLFLLFLGSTITVASARRPSLRISSPLLSLTIPDHPSKDDDGSDDGTDDVDQQQEQLLTSRRYRFVPKWFVGLTAEKETRTELALKRSRVFSEDAVMDNDHWAERTAMEERLQRIQEDRIVERKVEDAMNSVTKEQEKLLKQRAKAVAKSSKQNKYQFVGVIDRTKMKKKQQQNSADGTTPPPSSTTTSAITWYARPKPSNAKWSVRLVHVNQEAIIQDLFRRGKIDIFAKYTNQGVVKPPPSSTATTTDNSDDDSSPNPLMKTTNKPTTSLVPVVKSNYQVKERSWRTLWNFSPKHFFTDPSGMYWRERRLGSGGLYTDGQDVYETSYRYTDGRNGMHKVTTLSQFLASNSVDEKQKTKILNKLETAAPDIVMEL